MGWWIFVRSAIEALTRPQADIDACDRAVEELTQGSVIAGGMHRAGDALRSGWAHSRARALLVAAADQLPPESASGLRAAAWIVVVASATVLALEAVKPRPIGPLWWLLPVTTGIAGLLTMAMAAPLARAVKER